MTLSNWHTTNFPSSTALIFTMKTDVLCSSCTDFLLSVPAARSESKKLLESDELFSSSNGGSSSFNYSSTAWTVAAVDWVSSSGVIDFPGGVLISLHRRGCALVLLKRCSLMKFSRLSDQSFSAPSVTGRTSGSLSRTILGLNGQIPLWVKKFTSNGQSKYLLSVLVLISLGYTATCFKALNNNGAKLSFGIVSQCINF